MRHQRILDLNGTNPLSTGLDRILCAISDLQRATSIQGGYIPRIEPAITLLSTKIPTAYPKTSDLQASRGSAVARQNVPLVIDKPQTDTKYLPSCHHLLASLVLKAQCSVPRLVTVTNDYILNGVRDPTLLR